MPKARTEMPFWGQAYLTGQQALGLLLWLILGGPLVFVSMYKVYKQNLKLRSLPPEAESCYPRGPYEREAA